MTDEEKAALTAKDERIAQLEAELASRGKVADDDADEDRTPTPTQAQLDAIKLGHQQVEAGKSGAYKTRQTKAG